ncbi:MAG: UvrD-helicase domain-containing protein [Armatimonadetes bacterium]|nr:UvrD-helicase domain-containing protein [Armatimonadota bacterium]
MPSLLDGLNPEQREAAAHVDGPLLVFAGAGSGKTRTLTHRIAYLLAERGVRPDQVLAVTFTNKAAGEMRSRLERLCGPAAAGLWMGTFHGICVRLLRQYGEAVGVERNFTIFDEDDRQSVLRRVMADLNFDTTRFPIRNLVYRISDYKNDLVGPAEAARRAGDSPAPPTKVNLAVYAAYEKQLAAQNALDFDDLIMRAVTLLQDSDEVRETLQERFRYILVDEYQDINQAQYELVRLLSAKHRNLCVVGDDDQSIYGWRGARVEIILQFEDDYPDARVVKLERNYRSTQAVLEVANAVIAHNQGRREKQLRTTNPAGDPVVLHVAGNEQDEAFYVADMIRHGRAEEGRKFADHVILYRTNAQSRVFEQAFGTHRIPYQMLGGVRFYERREVRDLLAYLRALHNPADAVSLARILNVPARGIGDKTEAVVRQYALEHGLPLYQAIGAAAGEPTLLPARARNALGAFHQMMEELRGEATGPVTGLIAQVMARSGYEQELIAEGSIESSSRLENLRELLTVAANTVQELGRDDLGAFLETVALVSDTDALGQGDDKVVLMTLHSAKGLEFPVVFLVGLEEGLFPHSRSVQTNDVEEERRLCYVGMTRAQERLYLTRAWRRTLYGQTQMNQPSRFLGEVPRELLAGAAEAGVPRPVMPPPAAGRLDVGRSVSRARRTGSVISAPRPAPSLPPVARPQPAAPYKAGDKVRHRQFGEGIVVNCDGSEVMVAFPDQGVKKLALEYAGLEKV